MQQKPASDPPPIPLVPKRAGAAVGEVHGLLWSTAQERLDIASAALKVRGEQVSARVVYFGADQNTNPELDMITAQVVADLQALQVVHKKAGPSELPASRSDREIELIAMMRQRLETVLDTDPKRGSYLRARLDVMSRRITTLFFERALGHGSAPEELAAREVRLPEQGLWYAMVRAKKGLYEDLKSLRYTSPEVHDGALELFSRLEREVQTSFLARTAPELETLLPIVLDAFTEYLRDGFRRNIGDFCWQVVRASGVGRDGQDPAGMYRIGPRAFTRFREVFERHFLEALVNGVQEPLVERLEATHSVLSRETLGFMADPRVFSAVCSVMCDGFYDHLHSEGVLDLPPQWRTLAEQP